jgi:hypothetical protein
LTSFEGLVGFNVAGLASLDLGVELLPLSIEGDSLLLVLLYREIFTGTRGHLEGFFKSIRVYLLEDGFESDQGFL